MPDVTTYIINAADKTLTPNFSAVVASTENCITQASLEFFNTVTNKYVIDNTGLMTAGTPYEYVKSFSQRVGTLVINTTNIAKYAIERSYQLRISVWLTESIATAKSVDYYF